MKFLDDMNLSPRWVEEFHAAGWTCRHWKDVGPLTVCDREIMAFAREQGFIVVTHDLDFSAILAATQALGPSVVQIRADNLDPRVLGAHVIRAVSQQAVALQTGALLAVRSDSSSVRVLPLTSGVAGHTA